ncbi:phosphatidate cytidylyltransferase [bacterium]|nr:phosphatidate cytidylyltransferase [bacterium]
MSDLAKRLGVAVWGIPLLLISLYIGGLLLGILISLLLFLLAREWKYLGKQSGADSPLIYLWLLAASILFFQFSNHSKLSIGLAILAALVVFVSEIFRASRLPLKSLGHVTLWLIYVVIPVSLLWTIRQPGGIASDIGDRWLLALFVSVWVADTAAYGIGKRFGKHKLMPKASPNKSWEGAIAGLISAPIVALIMKGIGFVHFSIWDILAFTVIVGFIGQVGDLLESLMKREAELKDTSQFLPGHGGLLDRFDSLLLAIPALTLYLLLR